MKYFAEENKMTTRVAEAVVQWIFPFSTYCLCCGKPVDGTRSYSICDHCIHHITWGNVRIDLEAESRRLSRPSFLDSAVACVKYGLYERRLIFDLKYDGKTYVARAIADIMADRLTYGIPCGPASGISDGSAGGGFDYIVPVPVHRDRERARGFNQAEKIARHLAVRIGVPVLPRAVRRNRKTAPQRSLSAEDRYINLDGAFSVNTADFGRISDSRILLLDDVYTTGATAHQCGRVLKEAGALRVDFIAFATGNDFAHGFFTGE